MKIRRREPELLTKCSCHLRLIVKPDLLGDHMRPLTLTQALERLADADAPHVARRRNADLGVKCSGEVPWRLRAESSEFVEAESSSKVLENELSSEVHAPPATARCGKCVPCDLEHPRKECDERLLEAE